MSNSPFTNVKVFPLKKAAGNMKAHGTFLVGGAVEVRFTVIEGSKGIFASLPARKGNKPDEQGKIPWYPDVKILDEEQYNVFQNLVRNEYKKVTGGDQGDNTTAGEGNQDKQYNDGIPF